MTLKEVCDMTLMLMDSYTTGGAEIPDSYNNRLDVLRRMPPIINACQNYIATAAAKIPAVHKIAQTPYKNRIPGNMHKIIHFTGSDILLEANAELIGAYYFETNGIGSAAVEMLQDGMWVSAAEEEITVRPDGFTARRGLLPQPGRARLRFHGTHSYAIRNACLYAESFAAAEDIPPYTAERHHPVPADFYQLDGSGIAFCDAKGILRPSPGCRVERREILLPAHAEGEWTICYFKYPAQITERTPEDFKLDNTREAVLCIPYYTASHLLRADDAYRAQLLMNEFEVMLSRLNQASEVFARETEDFYPVWEGFV